MQKITGSNPVSGTVQLLPRTELVLVRGPLGPHLKPRLMPGIYFLLLKEIKGKLR